MAGLHLLLCLDGVLLCVVTGLRGRQPLRVATCSPQGSARAVRLLAEVWCSRLSSVLYTRLGALALPPSCHVPFTSLKWTQDPTNLRAESNRCENQNLSCANSEWSLSTARGPWQLRSQ